jgi:hypothetical protein
MTARRSGPWTWRALRLHVPLVLGVAVCLFAGWVELTRARAGHTVAWVYVVEWPMFAVGGIAIWWRLLTEHDDPRPADRTRPAERHDIPDDDPGLQAWRRYRTGLEQQGPERSDEVG